ncbi:MAG: Uma2 family endonuclease [Armatimonadetes bacterium]|nr:Uma2 family endonuclease [Armatimonadota bacterium]
MVTQAPTQKVSVEEFYQQLDEDTHAEWARGEVVPMSPVSGEHQDNSEFLLVLLSTFIRYHQLGEVRYEPFQMRLANSSRSPDILFVSHANLQRLKETYLDGAADLVVEVISPESRARDRGEKFYEYEEAGVREYWLIDPERKQAEFYQLGSDGVYRTVLSGSSGEYRSAVLEGLWLRVEWLWQKPKPTIVEVLREWGMLR